MVSRGWSSEMSRRADSMLADPSGYFERATKTARTEAAVDLEITKSARNPVGSRLGSSRSRSRSSASGRASTKY